MKELVTLLISLGVLVSLLIAVTAFGYAWLWFMVKRPDRWAMWVDKENNFWVGLGFVSSAFAERCKRREKGWPMKLMVGAIPVLGTSGLILIAMVLGGIILLHLIK